MNSVESFFILGSSNAQLCTKIYTVEINNMNKISHLAVNNTGILF